MRWGENERVYLTSDWGARAGYEQEVRLRWERKEAEMRWGEKEQAYLTGDRCL